MELTADSMPAPFTDYGHALAFGIVLDGYAYLIQVGAGLGGFDAQPQALLRDIHQAPGLTTDLPDGKGHASIAAPAFVAQADVDADDIAFLQQAIIRYAVANLLIDRSADHARKRRVAGRTAGVALVQRLGAATFQVVLNFRIQVTQPYAGLNALLQYVKAFSHQPAGLAHLGDLFRAFEPDSHVKSYPMTNWPTPAVRRAIDKLRFDCTCKRGRSKMPRAIATKGGSAPAEDRKQAMISGRHDIPRARNCLLSLQNRSRMEHTRGR